MDFLLSRRSDSARTLVKPGPNKVDLRKILKAAVRTPDHGKLEPWKFIILNEEIKNNIKVKKNC